MKVFSLFIILYYCCQVLGQVYINTSKVLPVVDCGDKLSDSEIRELREAFQIPDSVDFKEKKIGYIEGNGFPSYFISKKEFYNKYKGIGIIYVFDEIKKNKSCGYDIIFSSFTKKQPSIDEMPKYICKAKKNRSFIATFPTIHYLCGEEK